MSEQRRTATYDSYVNILLLDGEEAITLKVQNQDRGDTYVRTGRNVPMSFLMRAYADGPAGLVYNQIRSFTMENALLKTKPQSNWEWKREMSLMPCLI